MARGWESKSIEAQQAEASESAKKPSTRLSKEQQEHLRQAEGLQLSRKNLVHQLEKVSNPRHRQMLEDSLAELDRRLADLNEK
jgi:hypothetical protein